MFLENGVLYWCKVGTRTKSAKHSSPIQNIQIQLGKQHNIFQTNKYAIVAKEDCCFTLYFDGQSKALNLQSDSYEKRQHWCTALSILQQNLRELHTLTHPISPIHNKNNDHHTLLSPHASSSTSSHPPIYSPSRPAPIDLVVLPHPLPPHLASMVDTALTSIMGNVRGRIKQKMEDQFIIRQLVGKEI